MKYFKLKIKFLSQYYKKKKFNVFVYNIQRKFNLGIIFSNFNKFFIKTIPQKLNQFNIKNLKINYLAFIFIFFFSYSIYLTLPGILYDKSDQNYLTKILKEKYNLNFSLSSNISYSILPTPHFKILDVIIFNEKTKYQKELAQIKELKVFLRQNNFLKKNNLKLKSIKIKNVNFFVNNSDFKFLSQYFKEQFLTIPLYIKNGNLFYQDDKKSTITLVSIKKAEVLYNYNLEQKILKAESEVYNIPFDFLWKSDINTKENVTNLKFDKIKLNIENKSNSGFSAQNKKLEINLKRSKFETFYNTNEKVLNFFSKNSFIGNDKFTYSGRIDLNPFNFDINARIDNFNIKNLNSNIVFFKQIFNNEFALNEIFNGKVKLILSDLESNPFFDQITLKANFISDEIDLSKSIFYNNKILNLLIEKGIIYEEKENLYFRGNLNFDIHNIDKFHNKFVISKKSRVDLKLINVDILVNLTNMDLKIININIDNSNDKTFENIDNLIYDYNNGLIKITNWIEFKNFTNELITLYSG